MAHYQATAAGVTIRPARVDELNAIKALADVERAALGFVRRPALAEAIARGELLAAERVGEVVGFVDFHRRRDGQVTLYYIAVAREQRGRGVGRALLEGLRGAAAASGATRIALKCPVGLPANDFYGACGYSLQGVIPGRGRALAEWWLEMAAGGQPRLSPHPTAARGPQ